MKINFSQIYEGWKNNLFPSAHMKPLIEEVSAERMLICNECPYISTKQDRTRRDVHCTNCGCTLSAKTRCLTCECPIGKWHAVIDDKDKENEIKNAIGDGKE